jgi:hypothetical protein
MRTRIKLFFICLLGFSALSERADAHPDDEAPLPPIALVAQGHLKQGRYPEALAAAEAWIAEESASARAYGLATTTAIFARENMKAVAFARKSVELSPAAIGPRGSLVMALQLSGKRSEREIARAALYQLWRQSEATPKRPASFRRDDFEHEGKKIVAAEFFELQGQGALKYEFFVFEGIGKPIVYRISFGSSESANGVRTYHLDRNYPDSAHEAFGFYNSELSYDEVKAMVIAVISGKRKPVSAR